MPADFLDQNGKVIIGILVDDTVVEVGSNPNLQEKTTTPTEEFQRIEPDTGYDALSAVNVNSIPSNYEYINPSSTAIISENGVVDVRGYDHITVSVRQNTSYGANVSDLANQYHSIIFQTKKNDDEGKNTWDDWHIVPTSRPKFNMPSVKSNFVEIPGGDGSLDLTTALTGRPMYSNRQGSFEFVVLNDYGYWAERYSDIANYLHGKNFKATLCDDPDYYYEGRFYLNEWKSEKNYSKIVIDYNVGPYKRAWNSPGDRWLWDEFNFVTGYIENYHNIIVNNNEHTVIYPADVYETSPIFTCSTYNNRPFTMTVTINDNTPYQLNLGTNVLSNYSFINGSDNTIVFRGTGIVSIDNTGGSL